MDSEEKYAFMKTIVLTFHVLLESFKKDKGEIAFLMFSIITLKIIHEVADSIDMSRDTLNEIIKEVQVNISSKVEAETKIVDLEQLKKMVGLD